MTGKTQGVGPKGLAAGLSPFALVLRWCARLAGLLILFSAVPIALDVFSRKVFASAFFEIFEITTYLLAVAVAFRSAMSPGAGSATTIPATST